MTSRQKYLRPLVKAILLSSFVVTPGAVANGSNKVVGPRVRIEPGSETARIVLVRVQAPTCCAPCKKANRPCLECCAAGAKTIASAPITRESGRPVFENVPDGDYLLALEVGGRLTQMITAEPFQVKGDTTTIRGAVAVEIVRRPLGGSIQR